MQCPYCGTPLDRGQQFCSHCGKQIFWDESRSNIVQPTQNTSTYQPIPPSQAPQNPPPQKSRVPMLVLTALCTALVMVLIGVGLIATGTIRTGNQAQSSTGETGPTSSGSASLKSETKTTDVEEPTNTSPTSTTYTTSNSGSSEAASESSSGINTEASQSKQKANPVVLDTMSEPTSSNQSSEFILPDSSTRLYSVDELAGLSDWELYIARNEIYARHGRGFVRQDLSDYFASCSWYTRLYEPEYFDENISLSDVETANATTILDYEHYRGSPYT